MNEYASDYSKYMGHGSQSQGSHGSQAEDFMAQYADYTKYMQRMQQGGSPGESYMAQYMGQDGQTSQGGGSDYSKFMDQYASGFANMGQGSARTDSAKADVNYQKFMQGQASHPGDFSRYMAKYADYQKFIQSQANKEGTAGNSKHKSDTLAKKDSASSDSSATASPALLAAETASQPPDFKTAGAVSADFQHFLQNRNFGNYTGALDRYMSTRGSEAAGDFGKYFSEYKNFEQNKGKHESADFQHYMKGYADAYATHVQLGPRLPCLRRLVRLRIVFFFFSTCVGRVSLEGPFKSLRFFCCPLLGFGCSAQARARRSSCAGNKRRRQVSRISESWNLFEEA